MHGTMHPERIHRPQRTRLEYRDYRPSVAGIEKTRAHAGAGVLNSSPTNYARRAARVCVV